MAVPPRGCQVQLWRHQSGAKIAYNLSRYPTMMKTPILTIAATGVLALLGTVGCNRTDAPQPVLYPANTPVANDFNGPGAEEPNYGTRRRYVRTVSPRRESRSVET